jgi:hypothetical protein
MNSNISEKAREETYKARVPVRGKLEFKSLQAQFRSEKKEFEGTNVGREFDYRKYLIGSPQSPQRAIWHFASLPTSMASPPGDQVPVEFTFDIFKLTKGEQNKGAGVTFRFATHHAPQQQPTDRTALGKWPWVDPDREKAYTAAVEALANRGINPFLVRPGSRGWDEVNKLAEEYGCYEIQNKPVFDYQVMAVEIPAGLIRNALKDKDKVTGKDEHGNPRPILSVYVKCETPGQMLGVAEADLYLLEYEQPFAINFIKGMVGLWCWLCILVGLAVTWSTYLSGVLSMLVVLVIFVTGFFTDFIQDIGASRNVGGGPLQSISQLMKAEQPTTQLGDNAGAQAIASVDRKWAWFIRHVRYVFPDLESFDWSDFVSEGYNIRTEYLVVNLLVAFGYLLPWAILAYYLMKTREVAA